jgi:hypothetical protein
MGSFKVLDWRICELFEEEIMLCGRGGKDRPEHGNIEAIHPEISIP